MHPSIKLAALGSAHKGELLQELLRRLVPQGLVEAHGIVDPLPDEGLSVDLGHWPRQHEGGAFHVVLGRIPRQKVLLVFERAKGE